MPVAFLDLAQTCAPFVASETLAGVVSLESRFAPFNIRINSGRVVDQTVNPSPTPVERIEW